MANAIFGPSGERIVRLLVIVSLPSAVNANVLMGSRVLYSMSRDGLGIPVAARLNARGAPFVSIVATGLVAIAFLATGTFETIIAIAAFFFVANYATSFVGLIRLRMREPRRAAALSDGRFSLDDRSRAARVAWRSWPAPSSPTGETACLRWGFWS